MSYVVPTNMQSVHAPVYAMLLRRQDGGRQSAACNACPCSLWQAVAVLLVRRQDMRRQNQGVLGPWVQTARASLVNGPLVIHGCV